MLKIFAGILSVAGIGVIFLIASQSTGSGPAHFSGPEWIHSHY
jgi:hypothetical protein